MEENSIIEIQDFSKVDIRVGRIISVEIFPEAKKPALKLKIDFGNEIGIKKSSAQITENYNSSNLLNKQIIAVVNFRPRQIGPFISEVLTLGDKIDVIVLELDVEGRKLSLGHKHTKDNPWDKYENDFAVNTEHKTILNEIVDKGATIHFNDDITAFVPLRHMEKEDGNKLVKGEEATFRIIEFNKDFKRVVASHTSTFRNDDKKNKAKRKNQPIVESNEKATLGDIDALVDLKEKMDKK